MRWPALKKRVKVTDLQNRIAELESINSTLRIANLKLGDRITDLTEQVHIKNDAIEELRPQWNSISKLRERIGELEAAQEEVDPFDC